MQTIGRWSSGLAILFLVIPAATWVGCGGSSEGPAPAPRDAAVPAPAPGSTPAAAPASGSASIAGTITYDGEVPSLKPVSMSADPGCASKHDGPVEPEILVVGQAGALANVVVKVKSGLPDATWPAPSEPVVMDQNGCRYTPHVLAIMVGQPFKILNSDGLLHNVHALPEVNKQFNMAMPGSRTEAVETFNKAEDVFAIKCDVHPWMKAYVSVTSHPFVDVTEADGGFRIEGLPAGTYEIEAWHEKLGTRTASVTVAEGASESLSFTFSR